VQPAIATAADAAVAADAAASAPSAVSGRRRNEAIDWVRGLVMVVMALDHTRDFIGPTVDLTTAEPALFFTRWITHFCAPVFVLLAGTAAWLHGRRLPSTAVLSRYLATRGLWLILLEVTVVRAAVGFYLGAYFGVLQVIWAIGASMLALAMLVWLPRAALLAFAVATIAGHDLFDGVAADQLGSLRWLWVVLHQPGPLEPFAGARWFLVYPVVPWIAVMAAGYALGPWVALARAERRRRFFALGAALAAAFVILRASGVYGDPHPWSPSRGALAFLDCQKYPPSLLYLLMTLGPALLLLAAVDRPLPAWTTPILVYGRVPLFYYVLHFFLIHVIAVALAWPRLGSAALTHQYMPSGGLELSLPAVYALWVFVVVALYPACRWFAGVKRRSDAAWLTYL
jgi:uncharacterized membrane protein